MPSASLEVRFSTPGLSEHRKALSDLKRESKDAADSTRSMVAEMTASIDRLSNARRKMSDEERLLRNARSESIAMMKQEQYASNIKIRAMEAEIAKAKEVAAANKASANQPSILDRASLWVTGLNQAISLANKLAGVAGSFVLDAAKWESMTMALENMDGGATNAAVAISHLYEIAKAPGLSLETAEHAYIKLRAVGIAGADAERVIKDFSNTVARGGGSSVQFGRVLEQFVQMRGENRVLQQDLKFMKNSMPELASLMEKAFGTTTAAGIRKLGLNARQFTDGLLTEMEKLPKAQQTLTSEIENTATAWSRLKAAMVDTDWAKRFLSDMTSMFEHATNLMTGNKKGLAQDEYESKIKYTNKYVDYREGKRTLSSHDEVMWRKYGIGGKNVKRIDEAAAMAAYASATADVSMDQKPTDYDEKNPFKVRNRAEAPEEEKKKKFDPIEADRVRLREMLRSQAEETSIRNKFNDTVSKLTQEGVDDSEAKAIADRDKNVDEVRRKFNDMRKLAHGNAPLIAKIDEESARMEYETFVTWNDKAIAVREENNKKREDEIDDLKKKIAEKQYAIEQAESKKKEFDDAETAKWQVRADEIQSQYADEITQIQEQADRKLQILEIAGRKTVELEERINQERKNKENEYYTSRMKVGLDGTSSLFGALAEMEMARVDKMSDTYKTMFAIQKSFAIASATVDVVSASAKALNDWAAASAFERIALAGAVMAAGGGLVSQITSTAYAGVFDKGGDIPYGSFGVAGENGPEIVKGPAHVTSTKDTARMLAGAGRAPVVNVYNNAGANVEAKVNSDGSIDLLIDRVVAAAEGRIASGITSGNGSVDRSLRSTYGLGRGK